MRLSSACLVLLFGLVVVASAQTFLQKGCSSSNCGSCSSGACLCEELVQGSCYPTQTGGSGIGWCKGGYIKVRTFFVSGNCSGPFADTDTPLDQCYPAPFAGWVEYECPESYTKDHPAKELAKKSDVSGRVELKLPGPKFVPHEDSFDLSKHAPHVGVHQTFEGEVLTLKLGEAASHRRTPTWELRVGHSQPRLLGHSTVLNTTQLLQEAKGGSVTLRERNGKSNLYVLRK